METLRRVSAFLGPMLAAAALVSVLSCSESGENRGSTNMQSPQCRARGDSCSTNDQCCSLWCANSVCVRKMP